MEGNDRSLPIVMSLGGLLFCRFHSKNGSAEKFCPQLEWNLDQAALKREDQCRYGSIQLLETTGTRGCQVQYTWNLGKNPWCLDSNPLKHGLEFGRHPKGHDCLSSER